MINNNQIEFIKDEPFNIFKIQNFLNENFFHQLDKNFPDFNNLNKNSLFKFENDKFAITSGSEEYDKIILSNNVLKTFHELVNSKDFKKIFFFNLYMKIFFARKLNLKHMYKLLRIPKFVNKIDKSFISKYFSLNSNFKITIQYSYILNCGKIVPHPDAGDKILTLLLFFPYLNNKEELNYGTTFWNSNYKNYKDHHIKSIHEQNEFKKKSKILYEAQFLKNNLFGFIKNDFSWHSVEPINVQKNYIRKSININIYY